MQNQILLFNIQIFCSDGKSFTPFSCDTTKMIFDYRDRYYSQTLLTVKFERIAKETIRFYWEVQRDKFIENNRVGYSSLSIESSWS